MLLKKFGLDRKLGTGSILSYSLQNNSADVYADNIVLRNGGYEFDAVLKDCVITGIHLNMGGMHNVENMIAAIAVAVHLGVETDSIRQAVSSFKGVKRRFEYVLPLLQKKVKA